MRFLHMLLPLRSSEWCLIGWPVAAVFNFFANHLLPQEGYLSKVKALLGEELCVENGSHADSPKLNGQSNGVTENGSHGEEDGATGAMETEGEGEAVKSSSAPKARGGRKSKTEADAKSECEGWAGKFQANRLPV